jgi:hypothetical protein
MWLITHIKKMSQATMRRHGFCPERIRADGRSRSVRRPAREATKTDLQFLMNVPARLPRYLSYCLETGGLGSPMYSGRCQPGGASRRTEVDDRSRRPLGVGWGQVFEALAHGSGREIDVQAYTFSATSKQNWRRRGIASFALAAVACVRSKSLFEPMMRIIRRLWHSVVVP